MEYLIVIVVLAAIAAIASSKRKGADTVVAPPIITPPTNKLLDSTTLTGSFGTSDISITCDTARGGAISSVKLNGKELVDNHDLGRQFQLAMRYNSRDPEALNPTEAGNHQRQRSKVLELYKEDGVLITKTKPMYYLAAGSTSGNGNVAVNKTDLSNTIISKEVRIGYKGLHNIIVVNSKFVLEDITGLAATYDPSQFGISSRSGSSFSQIWTCDPKTKKLTSQGRFKTGKNHPSKLHPFVVHDGAVAWALMSRGGAGHNYSVKYANRNGSDIVGETGITGLFDVYRVASQPHATHEFETFYIMGTVSEVTNTIYELNKIFEDE
jgi:hypothetical protein